MAQAILIRRGLNGYKYAACDSCGNFIGNLDNLRQAHKIWGPGIRAGEIQLIKQLDQSPVRLDRDKFIKAIGRLH